MATFKVTLFIESGRNGWTENWYRTGVDNPNQYNDALFGAAGLIFKRRSCLADSCFLRYVRSSNTDATRDAAFNQFPGQLGRGLLANAGAAVTIEQVFDAVNCRVSAGFTRWRSWLCRGIPAGAITGGNIVAASPWRDALNQFWMESSTHRPGPACHGNRREYRGWNALLGHHERGDCGCCCWRHNPD